MNHTENNALRKLAGMAYHGGKTAQHWIDLVGIDPREVAQIDVSKSGLCYWTPRAESAYKAIMRPMVRDMAMLQGRINA